jgi:L-methionine (R)-S-oxide reductase
MTESIHVHGLDRKAQYESLLPQIKALVEGEENGLANMANMMAALKYGMGFFWVGIYFVRNQELVLGPFQGPVACTRIGKGKGVCGYAYAIGQTVIVKDVELFPGHIACSSESRSEIVVPFFNANKEVAGVLDVDSTALADFDETDKHYLEQLATLISGFNRML